MARRIVDAGYPLLLWARRPETLAAFRDTAAESVRTLAELGARADHVGICVVDDAGVREVVAALLPAHACGQPDRDSLHRPSGHLQSARRTSRRA